MKRTNRNRTNRGKPAGGQQHESETSSDEEPLDSYRGAGGGGGGGGECSKRVSLSPSKRPRNLPQHAMGGNDDDEEEAGPSGFSAVRHLDGSLDRPEKIASMLMHATEKMERCWNLDLQTCLSQYVALRPNPNFPEAAMVVSCAAMVYGRKVDYLGEIVMHMNHGQLMREHEEKEAKKKSGSAGEEGETGTAATSAPVKEGRKRSARFKQIKESDFDEIEFTVKDKDVVPLEQLMEASRLVEVDWRTKVRRMQEMCDELRAGAPSKRRAEILNRLRDEAEIGSLLSSHGMVRRNPILDPESGDSIGTRFDYQVFLNFIDSKTGGLIAEHDLKHYFQRRDVIDMLNEQQEFERERCNQLGIAQPPAILNLQPRECRLFLPPEYLRNQHNIDVQDTSDFEKALMEARISNYRTDPILELMGPEDEKRLSAIAEARLAQGATPLDGSIGPNDSGIGDSFNESEINANSTQNTDGPTVGMDTLHSSEDNPPDDELMALERSDTETKPSVAGTGEAGEKSTGEALRLSVDEGIGVDRDPPSLTQSPAAEKTEPAAISFGRGVVIPKPVAIPPVLLLINMLGLPETMVRKQLVFSLPAEYRPLKQAVMKRVDVRIKDIFTLDVYQLNADPMDPAQRPVSPELEDFLGFEEDEDKPAAKTHINKRPTKLQLEPPPQPRPATPEADFAGFNQEEIDRTKATATEWLARCPAQVKPLLESPKRTDPKPGSDPTTPNRTLSCDSGISDTMVQQSSSVSSLPAVDPIPEHSGDDIENDELPRPSEEVPSNDRIQQELAAERELKKATNDWEVRLKPLLLESEKRNHFDIHEYGTEIIDAFGEDAGPTTGGITLGQVLENKPPHSIARYFLSALMLANTNNLRIVNQNSDMTRRSHWDEISLHLLDRKRHHEELDQLGEMFGSDLHAQPRPSRSAKAPNRKRKGAAMTGTLLTDPTVRWLDAQGMEGTSTAKRNVPDNRNAVPQLMRFEARSGLQKPAVHEELDDDLLTVDLDTHHAELIPAPVRPFDFSCAQSVYSMADSAYCSTIRDADQSSVA
uniref:Condensin-2 complex subunit H2 C-terminal domain-containing protein n=1 Tax=Anopheles albimanus TaxID=7167 RepID=A0A1Y9G8E5_ANOAL